MIKTHKLQDISILRSASIIIVVAFHIYGMMYDGSHFSEATRSAYRLEYWLFNQCIFINIAMPMFTFISGYLFYYLLEKNKYTSWKQLLTKKTSRILIPYFVFGLIMMATTNNFHPIKLLTGGYWHLWFLPMLFWCFIVSYTLRNIKHYLMWFIIAGCFALSLCDKFIPSFMGLHNISKWYCWFILGGGVWNNRLIICDLLSLFNVWIVTLCIALGLFALYPIEYGEYNIMFLMGQILMIVTLWYITYTVTQKWNFNLRLICLIDKYSYGIYIFHNWIAMYLISSTAKRLFSLETLAEKHIVLFPLVFFILTLSISLFLSWALLKTKIGKFLIG